jgi:hypothetical protein
VMLCPVSGSVKEEKQESGCIAVIWKISKVDEECSVTIEVKKIVEEIHGAVNSSLPEGLHEQTRGKLHQTRCKCKGEE